MVNELQTKTEEDSLSPFPFKRIDHLGNSIRAEIEDPAGLTIVLQGGSRGRLVGDIDETVSDAVERAEHLPESRRNAVVAVLVAVIAGLAEFLGWNLHPDVLARFLS